MPTAPSSPVLPLTPVSAVYNIAEVASNVPLLSMTNAQMIDLAMSRLGRRKSTDLREQVVLEINMAIDRLETGMFIPWFLEGTVETIWQGSSQQGYTWLGPQFSKEVENTRPYYVLDDTVHYLEKRFYGVLVGEEPTGIEYYAIRGQNEFHVRKVPEVDMSIYVPIYLKSVSPLLDDDEEVNNSWLLYAHDWVIAEALSYVAAFHLNNEKLATIHEIAARKAKNDQYTFHEARKHENQDYFVGGASDGT